MLCFKQIEVISKVHFIWYPCTKYINSNERASIFAPQINKRSLTICIICVALYCLMLQGWIPTRVLGGDLSFALFAPSLFALLLAAFLLVTVGLSSSALPDLALLPLDGFSTCVSSKLRLHIQHAGPDRMTLTTGLIALRPLSPLWHHTVYGWGDTSEQKLCGLKEVVKNWH